MIEHFGQTRESLSRLRGPIGIYIGSETPAEIAVSVMAEILAIRNGVQLSGDSGVAKAKSHLGVIRNEKSRWACELNLSGGA